MDLKDDEFYEKYGFNFVKETLFFENKPAKQQGNRENVSDRSINESIPGRDTRKDVV